MHLLSAQAGALQQDGEAIDLGQSPAPQDCQTIAWSELASLNQRMKSLLENQAIAGKLDAYSRAHLQESSARIRKVLDARLTLNSP